MFKQLFILFIIYGIHLGHDRDHDHGHTHRRNKVSMRSGPRARARSPEEQKRETEKALDKIDKICTHFNSFGDPSFKMPEDSSKLQDICKEIMGEITGDGLLVALQFAGSTLTSNKTRPLFLFLIGDMIKSPLCQKDKVDSMIPLAKEINAKANELAPSRKNIMTVLTDASKNDTKISKSKLACYVKKYVDETMAKLSPELKKFFLVPMKPWISMSDMHRPDKTCDWSTEQLTKFKYKSFEMMFLDAAKHTFYKNQ